METTAEIAAHFGISHARNITPMSGGRINLTFSVECVHRCFVLQKLHPKVFSAPEAVMENALLVTDHLHRHFPECAAVHFYPASDGKYYYAADDGGIWRLSDRLEGISFNSCASPRMAAALGKAYGQFLRQLSGMDGSRLLDTVPNLHNTPKHFDTLLSHGEDLPETAMLSALRTEASELWMQYASGALPERIVHNDTKCSNVLVHPVTLEPLAVIDLDTVMRGMAAYDFGDALRSICGNGPDMDKICAFCSAYLHAAGDLLTPAEIRAFSKAPFCVSAELAARYLADFLSQNGYFQAEGKLTRARQLLDLAVKFREMEETIADILNEYI